MAAQNDDVKDLGIRAALKQYRIVIGRNLSLAQKFSNGTLKNDSKHVKGILLHVSSI